ncbi:MAG: 30S ribosomal protein S18 [Proteobacteria bacterium]|nr:30S ribosomal protein S18 [Pseudomonadota bacterium]
MYGDRKKKAFGKKKGFKKKGRLMNRPRVCRFCADKKLTIDYKDARLLTGYTTERGKIIPRRISGCCARHQRELTLAIKRGRILAFIPFTATQVSMS